MCSRVELKLIFDLSYVNLLLQTTLFCVLIVLFEQVVLVGDIRLPATNVYRMLYSYQAKDKSVLKVVFLQNQLNKRQMSHR